MSQEMEMQHHAGVRLIADGGLRVSLQLQRNFSHYTKCWNADKVDEKFRGKHHDEENYMRGISVCRCMLIRKLIGRIIGFPRFFFFKAFYV